MDDGEAETEDENNNQVTVNPVGGPNDLGLAVDLKDSRDPQDQYPLSL